jgi:hypothetical protein
MENPPNLNYCKITGNFKAFIADNNDEDDLPDFVPMVGTGFIWPNITAAKNMQVGYKSSYFNSRISVYVDSDGDLSQGGRKYVKVLASSPGIVNPENFNYSIQLDLTAYGESENRVYGPFSFDIIPGGEVDMADVIPVSAYGGQAIIQGPPGAPGDLIGVTQANWAGIISLPLYPRTYIATLVGNVQAMVLPTGMLAEQSGTITIVSIQDAVGGRTITWPTEVLWPEGIEPQPTPGANTVSMFNLLWTGTQWLGLLGGKSFA